MFNGLEREARILDNRLCVFTDAQKADSAMLLFVGNVGGVEAKAIRTKRIARGDSGDAPAITPDYPGAMIETLSKIKTLAVQEAVATNPRWRSTSCSIALSGRAFTANRPITPRCPFGSKGSMLSFPTT